MPVYPGAPPVPAATFQTFNAPYAGRFIGAALPGSSPLPWPSPPTAGLGSSSPHPKGGLLTTRQASLDAADRLVAPPEGLLTLGFDPTRFPDQAASLLPGLLAATRTGLTPAGDDELMLDHDLHIDLQLWRTRGK